MDAKTAAAQANVTVNTIRAWCRYGAVAAVKARGRWDIDPDSLARRIALAAPAAHITSVQIDRRGRYVAVGPAAALESAFTAGRAVPVIAGKCTGDTLHLGLKGATYGDYGVTPTLAGPTATYDDGTAAYAIDTTRLDAAPALAQIIAEIEDRAVLAEATRRRGEDDYLNPTYE